MRISLFLFFFVVKIYFQLGSIQDYKNRDMKTKKGGLNLSDAPVDLWIPSSILNQSKT